MTPELRAVLQQLGADLDAHRQVRVRVGGVVIPEPISTGVVTNAQRPTRSTAGPRQRPSRRERTSGRSRPPSSAPSLRRGSLRASYEAQVGKLEKAYPSAAVVARDSQGMWLKIESLVLTDLGRTATFLVALPFAHDQFPRAWGFWSSPIGPTWIGPRHTNFTDGSVCAFVPQSGTWRPGDRIDVLLDLYSVWALRHLYLEVFKRWPGGQFSPHPYYSLVEFKPDEFCGCDAQGGPRHYGACCRPEHIGRKLSDLKADFERVMGCRLIDRNPPRRILDHIAAERALPPICEALAVPAIISRP